MIFYIHVLVQINTIISLYQNRSCSNFEYSSLLKMNINLASLKRSCHDKTGTMKGFSVEKDGKIIGYLVNPEDGDPVDQHHLEALKPYVKHVVNKIDTSDMVKGAVQKIQVDDSGRFTFADSTEETDENFALDEIVEICRKRLTEQLIVPQDMGTGRPTIRHRVLYFSHGSDSDSIDVKYTELGDFNSIDVALETLEQLYPEA